MAIFVLRHSGLELGRCRKTFFPFRSRLSPQRLKYRSRWMQEGLNLARPKSRRRHLTSTFKKPDSKHEHSLSLTRQWSRTSRLGRCRMNTKSPLLRCETSHLAPGQVLHPVNTKLPDNRLHQVTWPRCHQNFRPTGPESAP